MSLFKRLILVFVLCLGIGLFSSIVNAQNFKDVIVRVTLDFSERKANITVLRIYEGVKSGEYIKAKHKIITYKNVEFDNLISAIDVGSSINNVLRTEIISKLLHVE